MLLVQAVKLGGDPVGIWRSLSRHGKGSVRASNLDQQPPLEAYLTGRGPLLGQLGRGSALQVGKFLRQCG